MKGDVTNLTRAMLSRLSASSALISLVCGLVFLAGNTSSLSGQAIAVTAFGMGVTGFATLLFAISSVVVSTIASCNGARFPLATFAVAVASGIWGFAAIVTSGIISAITRGLSF